MNIMFDQSFCVLKEEFPVDLKYENIIFVFEDVDAATPIVHQRPFSEKSNKRSRKQHRRAPARRPITSATHSPPAVRPSSGITLHASLPFPPSLSLFLTLSLSVHISHLCGMYIFIHMLK